jgi:hypothetical protein
MTIILYLSQLVKISVQKLTVHIRNKYATQVHISRVPQTEYIYLRCLKSITYSHKVCLMQAILYPLPLSIN